MLTALFIIIEIFKVMLFLINFMGKLLNKLVLLVMA